MKRDNESKMHNFKHSSTTEVHPRILQRSLISFFSEKRAAKIGLSLRPGMVGQAPIQQARHLKGTEAAQVPPAL